ncbi:ribosomal silencing factor RsfS [Leminorella grimontii]|uniref:Ribosomal silencing factor RsfS n=1 Tax=Leminorella grimontii TaxID=82981 RepID=A0AAV5MX03_9GAMM|nr:ribosome silencing factor [Leminorella grimontii]KFC95616.1 iojap protein [Leminorella grimontii ATCC 33999 = DSM 5078]GKX54205.1 ribosomal silencing factor RsfS [Leminorella grimontii]VFS59789.1 ribosome-associated protein [Leminorella grimontii]
MQGRELQSFVIDKIEDVKGQDIVSIDVSKTSSITDCMIICTGTSSKHVQSIAEHVFQAARQAGMDPLGVESDADGEWIVVDLDDIMVHVLQDESRRRYELEKLWS